jgi:hypothetical protein
MTGLVFDKAQTEGLEVHPEPCSFNPPSKVGFSPAEWVNPFEQKFLGSLNSILRGGDEV